MTVLDMEYFPEYSSEIDVSLMDYMGGDDGVIRAAKVSTLGGDVEDIRSMDPVAKQRFIEFLMKNRHGTPFEHGTLQFRVHAPIFVFREWHRHRIGWSYNEESARYREMRPVFYLPSDVRPLVQEGKPGAYVYVEGTPEQYEAAVKDMTASYELAYSQYKKMLAGGVARELARTVLPVGIYSSMYATMNPRALMHFLSLRTKHETSQFPSYPQYEIETAAIKMELIFEELFPLTHAAFHKFGRVAP